MSGVYFSSRTTMQTGSSSAAVAITVANPSRRPYYAPFFANDDASLDALSDLAKGDEAERSSPARHSAAGVTHGATRRMTQPYQIRR